ncbi:unnamed protein product, partial [Sphacelaria rigidula]
VGQSTPRQLWLTPAKIPPSTLSTNYSGQGFDLSPTRVPLLRARGLRWGEGADAEFMSREHDLLANVKYVQLTRGFKRSLGYVVWPQGVRKVTFVDQSMFEDEDCFNQPIDGVIWPALLQQLKFGGTFNQPLAGMLW